MTKKSVKELVHTPWGYVHPIDLPDEYQDDAPILTLTEKLNRPRCAVNIITRAACVLAGVTLGLVIIMAWAALS